MKITISGKPGSGKSSVGKELAKILKMRFVSLGDIVGELAAARDMTLLDYLKLAEKDRSIDKEIDDRQIQLGKEDNIILDSRLGFHFIPDSVKIFLDTDIDTAARRIFRQGRSDEKENLTLEMTKENLQRRIDSERKRYKKYYGLDHFDLKNYDIVIDASDITVEETVDMILPKLEGGF